MLDKKKKVKKKAKTNNLEVYQQILKEKKNTSDIYVWQGIRTFLYRKFAFI